MKNINEILESAAHYSVDVPMLWTARQSLKFAGENNRLSLSKWLSFSAVPSDFISLYAGGFFDNNDKWTPLAVSAGVMMLFGGLFNSGLNYLSSYQHSRDENDNDSMVRAGRRNICGSTWLLGGGVLTQNMGMNGKALYGLSTGYFLRSLADYVMIA